MRYPFSCHFFSQADRQSQMIVIKKVSAELLLSPSDDHNDEDDDDVGSSIEIYANDQQPINVKHTQHLFSLHTHQKQNETKRRFYCHILSIKWIDWELCPWEWINSHYVHDKCACFFFWDMVCRSFDRKNTFDCIGSMIRCQTFLHYQSHMHSSLPFSFCVYLLMVLCSIFNEVTLGFDTPK